jgi:hypothetical protein
MIFRPFARMNSPCQAGHGHESTDLDHHEIIEGSDLLVRDGICNEYRYDSRLVIRDGIEALKV